MSNKTRWSCAKFMTHYRVKHGVCWHNLRRFNVKVNLLQTRQFRMKTQEWIQIVFRPNLMPWGWSCFYRKPNSSDTQQSVQKPYVKRRQRVHCTLQLHPDVQPPARVWCMHRLLRNRRPTHRVTHLTGSPRNVCETVPWSSAWPKNCSSMSLLSNCCNIKPSYTCLYLYIAWMFIFLY